MVGQRGAMIRTPKTQQYIYTLRLLGDQLFHARSHSGLLSEKKKTTTDMSTNDRIGNAIRITSCMWPITIFSLKVIFIVCFVIV